jgi:hypothetical protein
MKLKLEADFSNEVVNCDSNYSCLNDGKSCLCEVESVVNDKLFFIKPDNPVSCNHMTSFGYSYYCNCPVRKEIYRLYNI